MAGTDEDEEVGGYGFADAKSDLGIDQPSFADRVLGNPDIPRGDVEDRRDVNDTLLGQLGADAKKLLNSIPFEAKRRYGQATDILGLTSDETRFDELKKLAASFK